jgi:type II secretory pathway component PulM
MLNTIIAKWHQLARREQSLLFGTSIFLLGYFIYLIISGLNNSIADNQTELLDQKKLITWMRPAVNTLLSNENVQRETSQVSLDELFKKYGLENYVLDVSETDMHTASVKFKPIPFDTLSNWLLTIWKNHGIKVLDINCVAIPDNVGMVTASLVLSDK